MGSIVPLHAAKHRSKIVVISYFLIKHERTIGMGVEINDSLFMDAVLYALFIVQMALSARPGNVEPFGQIPTSTSHQCVAVVDNE